MLFLFVITYNVVEYPATAYNKQTYSCDPKPSLQFPSVSLGCLYGADLCSRKWESGK